MAYANYSAPASSATGSTVFATIQAAAVRVAAWYAERSRERAARRSLRHLDDHILRDIGLSREQVDPHDPFVNFHGRYRSTW